ncbi:hypothetical protein ACFQLX_07330 [Streptomyces polyrhachis]|uniref:Uncharacterized protein n=1 Tax=Streptomyces polyrhachis TaxID=1282885 RepID=A0ABW2GB80_9ACTN
MAHMASIRTARLIAAVASIPLAAAMMGGIAHADDGAFAHGFSNAANVGQSLSVKGKSGGINSQVQQVALGGGSNKSNSANVIGWGNYIDQSETTILFSKLW